ncbi:hypothetical protein ACLIBK_24155, partial [Roseomonas sp. BN140053]
MAEAALAAPTEALAGLVERVTFHNAENGFCVLRVKARGHKDLVTVVGHAATIAAGEWVQLSGSWSNDRTHCQRRPDSPQKCRSKFPQVLGGQVAFGSAGRALGGLPRRRGG